MIPTVDPRRGGRRLQRRLSPLRARAPRLLSRDCGWYTALRPAAHPLIDDLTQPSAHAERGLLARRNPHSVARARIAAAPSSARTHGKRAKAHELHLLPMAHRVLD